MSLQSGERDPPMLDIWETAHVLSVKTCTCFPLIIPLKVFKAYKMSIISRALMCKLISVLDYRPPVLRGPQTALQPPELEASVFISTSGFLLSTGKEE